MGARVVVAAVLGALLLGCGAPPEYARRQAAIDMADFVHVFNSQSKKYDDCIVTFLFHGWSPQQVKAEIQGADFGAPSPILLAAKNACTKDLPETGGCKDAAPTATTAAEAPKSSSTETTGHTAYLNLHSPRQQIFTGSKPQTVVLPNPASINLGDAFVFTNRSTGVLTVKAIDYRQILEAVTSVAPNASMTVTCKYPTVPAWSASAS